MTSTASLSCSRMFLKISRIPAGTTHCIPSPLLCRQHLKDPRQCSLPAVFFPHLLASLISFPFQLLMTWFHEETEAVTRATLSWLPIPSGRKGRAGTQTWVCRLGTDLCLLVLPPPSPKLLFIRQYPALGAPPPKGFSASQNEVLEEFSDDSVVRIPGSRGLGSIPGLGTGIP